MIVPKGLEERFLEPEGWRWHYLKNSQGRKLRFGTVHPKSSIPNAVIVILPGRTEFAEKYFEIARDLIQQNLSVWILEWQGQGLSDRYVAKHPQRGHSSDFREHVDDLHEFILEYVKHACVHPDVGRIPMVMLAHSMGANIGLRYLYEHPGMFESAALTAPLLAIPSVEKFFAGSLIIKIMSALTGKSYAFGQKDWNPEHNPNDPVIYSRDPVRKEIYNAWMKANPELRSGGATFGWVRNALESSIFLLKPETLQAIKTPCLIAEAGDERLVDNKAIQRIARELPNATLLELEGSGHEILMESDDIRNKFMNAFMQLVKETVIDRPESLKTF